MCPEPSAQITKLLANWRGGDEQARDALIPLVYNELRRLARLRLWHQRPGHTFQSAALVNEAYLRLARQNLPQWQNRAHFFGVAAQVMRHILVDHARSQSRQKRGMRPKKVTLNEIVAIAETDWPDLLDLDHALHKRVVGHRNALPNSRT